MCDRQEKEEDKNKAEAVTTLATLTQEERRLLEDIQPHLPNHIRNLPEQEKMQFLEMHILALRKHLKHEQRFLAVVEKAKQALKLVSKVDVSSSSVSPGSVSVASMSPAASSAVQSEVVLSSEAKSSIGITREEDNKMSSAMNYLLIEGKSATKEVRHFEQWCTKNNIEIQRPNSMNNYGAILDHFGFDSVIFFFELNPRLREVLNEIMTQLLQPLSRILFIVSYETDKDVKLDFHRDDSELTLNVCLGTDFEGGELYFGGVRCRQHQQLPPTNEEGWNIPHKVGHGLIHLGAHRHSATPIKSGISLAVVGAELIKAIYTKRTTLRKNAKNPNVGKKCK